MSSPDLQYCCWAGSHWSGHANQTQLYVDRQVNSLQLQEDDVVGAQLCGHRWGCSCGSKRWCNEGQGLWGMLCLKCSHVMSALAIFCTYIACACSGWDRNCWVVLCVKHIGDNAAYAKPFHWEYNKGTSSTYPFSTRTAKHDVPVLVSVAASAKGDTHVYVDKTLGCCKGMTL